MLCRQFTFAGWFATFSVVAIAAALVYRYRDQKKKEALPPDYQVRQGWENILGMVTLQFDLGNFIKRHRGITTISIVVRPNINSQLPNSCRRSF